MNRTNVGWDGVFPEPFFTCNPFIGCSHASEGCANCYAERMAARMIRMGNLQYQGTIHFMDKPEWSGETYFLDNRLDAVRKHKGGGTIFWCSMSDLFHDNNSYWDIAEIFKAIQASNNMTHVVLTKRPERMAAYFKWNYVSSPFIAESNLYLGVTAENQARADERIPVLLSIPGQHKRFVSVEPMLGPVDLGLGSKTWDFSNSSCEPWNSRWVKLNRYVASDIPFSKCVAKPGIYRAKANQYGALSVPTEHGYLGIKPKEFTCLGSLDLVIIGPENGPNKRPCKREWILDLKRQCDNAGVRCYLKEGARKAVEE